MVKSWKCWEAVNDCLVILHLLVFRKLKMRYMIGKIEWNIFLLNLRYDAFFLIQINCLNVFPVTQLFVQTLRVVFTSFTITVFLASLICPSIPQWRSSGVTYLIPLCLCSWLYHRVNLLNQLLAPSMFWKPFSGHHGQYLIVRKSDSE